MAPNDNTIGIGINDMPLWLFKEFKEECRKFHNDQHWVTLLSWYEKARAYEQLMSGQASVAVPVQQEDEPQTTVEKDERPPGVMTIGGLMRGR